MVSPFVALGFCVVQCAVYLLFLPCWRWLWQLRIWSSEQRLPVCLSVKLTVNVVIIPRATQGTCTHSLCGRVLHWIPLSSAVQSDMQRGVHGRLMDNSTSVREAAVELLGRFVLSRPQLTEQYYDMLIERILVIGLCACTPTGSPSPTHTSTHTHTHTHTHTERETRTKSKHVL